MKNDLVSNALQKFYSALKNLKDFSINNDIIDNISSIDCFFSEFRNITFVMQKDFSDGKVKSIYEELCSKYLKNDKMKWFIKQRNNTIKQAPIKLQKSIIFDIYMPSNRIVIESEQLQLDVDESFNWTKDFVERFLINEIGFVDIYFSARIVFKENDEKVEILPKIISGIETMLSFFKEMFIILKYEDYENDELFKKIVSLYETIIINGNLFVHDYYTQNGIIKSVNSNLEFYIKEENFLKKLNKYRTPVNKEFFGNENNVQAIFERFEIMHINLYRLLNGNLMPVFMILYKDFTMQLLPVYATHKTLIYRQVYDIVDNIDFQDINAIFYCGEMYTYDFKMWDTINNLEYEDRINKANLEILFFFYIDKDGKIKNTNINIKNINDDKYIVEELKKENYCSNNDIFFLKPIIEKMKKSLD